MELVKNPSTTEQAILDLIENDTKCNAYFVRVAYLNLHNTLKSHGKKLSPWLKESIEDTSLKLRAFDQKIRAKLPLNVSAVLTDALKSDVICSTSNLVRYIGYTTYEQHETVDKLAVILEGLVREKITTEELNTQLDSIINSFKK